MLSVSMQGRKLTHVSTRALAQHLCVCVCVCVVCVSVCVCVCVGGGGVFSHIPVQHIYVACYHIGAHNCKNRMKLRLFFANFR